MSITIAHPVQAPAPTDDPLRPIELVPDLAVFVAGKPISVNAMYGARRPGATSSGRGYGNRYITGEAAAWEQAVHVATLTELNRRRPPAPWRARLTFTIPLRVRCTFYNVRADADNLLKCTLDGLKTALRVDDRDFSPVEAVRLRDKKQPQGARIEVWVAGQHTQPVPPAPVMSEADLIEALADQEHAGWARWMAWLFRCCHENADGSMTIPPDRAQHWRRQVLTPYADLSEREKQSDRHKVAHILPIIRAFVAQHGA